MSRNANLSSTDTAQAPGPAPVVVFDKVSLGPSGCGRTGAEISFCIAPGSFHFLTGAPGSGKSAVLEVIGLARQPAGGQVDVLGRDLASLSAKERPALRRRIGMVFDDPRLIEDLTAFDNVALAARVAGRKAAAYRDQVAELLTWIGLGARMASLPSQLSAAEQRSLAIARAVINSPDLLIADEPTGRLEGTARFGVLRLLADLNRAGTTVLIATRDAVLAEGSGAPVILLAGGGAPA
jgi:cell division transport system ATP-binding protein